MSKKKTKVIPVKKKTTEGLQLVRYKDAFGNIWSAAVFSAEEALLAAQSLTACSGCVDCRNCTRCVDCDRCTDCVECVSCQDCCAVKQCRNSVSGKNSKSCTYCDTFDHCLKCTRCHDISKSVNMDMCTLCDDCEMCLQCYQCKGCKLCQRCSHCERCINLKTSRDCDACRFYPGSQPSKGCSLPMVGAFGCEQPLAISVSTIMGLGIQVDSEGQTYATREPRSVVQNLESYKKLATLFADALLRLQKKGEDQLLTPEREDDV